MKGYNLWRDDVIPKLGAIVEMASLGVRAMNQLAGPRDVSVDTRDLWNILHAWVEDGTASDYIGQYLKVLPGDRAVYTSTISNGALTRHFLNGPKAYAPSAGEYAALNQIEPNVSWDDYQQPFGSFCLVVPESASKPLNDTMGRPLCVLVDFDPATKKFVGYVPCDRPKVAPGSGLTNKYDIVMIRSGHDGDQSVSEFLNKWLGVREADRASFLDFGVDTTDLRPVSARLVAAACNACLLLSRHGAVHRGKGNPLQAADLAKSLAKKKLPDKIRASLTRQLAMLPDVYSFSQEIRLHDTEGEPGEPGDPTGRQMPPHWRRGHWARQRHGAALAETKLIFRKPCLVRADRFAGDLAHTGATYQGA